MIDKDKDEVRSVAIRVDEDSVKLDVPDVRGDGKVDTELIVKELLRFRDTYLSQALEGADNVEVMVIDKHSLYLKRFCHINLSTLSQISLNYYGKTINEAFFMILTRDGNIFTSKDFQVKEGYWK